MTIHRSPRTSAQRTAPHHTGICYGAKFSAKATKSTILTAELCTPPPPNPQTSLLRGRGPTSPRAGSLLLQYLAARLSSKDPKKKNIEYFLGMLSLLLAAAQTKEVKKYRNPRNTYPLNLLWVKGAHFCCAWPSRDKAHKKQYCIVHLPSTLPRPPPPPLRLRGPHRGRRGRACGPTGVRNPGRTYEPSQEISERECASYGRADLFQQNVQTKQTSRWREDDGKTFIYVQIKRTAQHRHPGGRVSQALSMCFDNKSSLSLERRVGIRR